VARASRTLYLNRTGFNGLFRVNKSGLFNVPFGRHKSPLVFDASNLTLCSKALQGQEIATGSYADVFHLAEAGDLVYLDPPYVPLSKTSAFTQYAQGGFTWADQERLADLVHGLARRQVHVLLSNADVPELRALYGRYSIVSLTARRRINSKVARRGPIGEILVVAEPSRRP
jgi:DNA adenine methylase